MCLALETGGKKSGGGNKTNSEKEKNHDPFITGTVSGLFDSLVELCCRTVTGKLNWYQGIMCTRLEPLTAQVAESVWSVL